MKNKKVTKKPYHPDGVYDVRSHSLNQESKSTLLKIAKAENHKRRNEFINAIELAIGRHEAASNFSGRTKPSLMKDRLKDLQKKAKLLMKDINKLDEFSTQLLSKSGRSPDWERSTYKQDGDVIHVGAMPDGSPLLEMRKGFTFEEAAKAIPAIYWHASNAVEKINEYNINGRHPDTNRQSLAIDTAKALKEELNIELTNDPDGIFSNMLREVMFCAKIKMKKGISKEVRDVRELVKYALSELSLAK